ncbi:MAG: DegT/DnrJ/EryC1/StrS family aminotransferase [Pyrinomonadaceae bacterium]|nr:DegT/DnrJ/EryC1/StrS family aminotransferase [Pyrinomonadaceae bacterium]
MNVPLLDLRAQHESLRGELLAAMERVMDSQQFVLGPEVQAFEEEMAQYTKTRHAIGCASGSDALLLALLALGVGTGDEVITSPFTFFATAGAIARSGARPVFVDIDPHTYNIDPAQVEAAITPRTRAIMPVHLYGQCADMTPLLDIGARRNLPLIEDAAQAIGSEDRGRTAGSMGLIGCFSFYPTKNLGGAGDGGLLTTNDEELCRRLKALRVHGGTTEYHHREVGINSRLDSLQAAVLRVKLKCLDVWSGERQKKAQRYNQLFQEAKLEFELFPPFVRPRTRHIFHQYVVRVPRHRDAMMNHLNQKGVGTKIYYPVPLHEQECFQYLRYKEGAFPQAERAARETVAIPCFPELTEEQQGYVVDAISSFEASGSSTARLAHTS